MKDKIKQLIKTSLQRLQENSLIDKMVAEPTIQIERTRDLKHGDYASNIAMLLAKNLKKIHAN